MSYCVFLDVDETLINSKTLLATFRHHLNSVLGVSVGEERFAYVMDTLSDAQAAGFSDRASLNQLYYRHFANIDVASLATTCESWFNSIGIKLLKTRVCDEIARHQQRNAQIVLVSGSYHACLDPLSRYLKADAVLCTELVSAQGVYTGELQGCPTIGEGKARRIADYIAQHRFSLRGSFAYGDHQSDVPMLEMADEKVIVDNYDLYSALRIRWPELEWLDSQQAS
ncbi:HAD-IB family hydrolase [Xenorhabdus ehlersii]|uniref:HAD superfamily hydrolase (TIGR01490 family) n=1 Tax=Xenorhabdus ehlersii TaxID=290111 RepID=A0A2D0IM14_9GAMM|nr:HAD-IB family hydrolase [Xenorhabdus ehlersii]PHM22823.1 phosphatase [Xenorhabdus ehlersii]RKE93125.1 HAD superfamily hydrolase (TIGR01490 family) [Xenorhabdus ehlersii]